MTRYVYLGDRIHPPNISLAIDEILHERVNNKTVFIRFYSFPNPTIILALRQSLDDLKQETVQEKGIDIARRLTEGGAMYCDQDSLCYSVIGNGEYPQKTYGIKIARVLSKEMKSDIYIGKDFSLRTSENTIGVIAGNGTKHRYLGGPYLYHGIIANRQWNLVLLDEIIELSQEEQYIIPRLPYIERERSYLRDRLLEELTDGNYEQISESDYQSLLLEAEKLSVEKYSQPDWLHHARTKNDSGPTKMETAGGFCFCVTWGEPEKIIGVVKYSELV